MNAIPHFGTLRCSLICIQSCLLMSLITRTANRTGLKTFLNVSCRRDDRILICFTIVMET